MHAVDDWAIVFGGRVHALGDSLGSQYPDFAPRQWEWKRQDVVQGAPGGGEIYLADSPNHHEHLDFPRPCDLRPDQAGKTPGQFVRDRT